MDPRNKNAKEIINSKIKRREPWRPYAPSVLASHASDWFELEGLSQYMLRSVAVRNSKRAVIPAVVHEDGSSRVQTVLDDGDQEPTSFAALLAEFYKLTGVPLLLNTSLNSGGSPIFSSAGESLDFFKSIPMDAICIGNELYVK
jgi:carbamoyltransferase